VLAQTMVTRNHTWSSTSIS